MPTHIARNVLTKVLNPNRLLGSRADHAHLAAQYIDELRQFVERVAPEKRANPGHARVVFGRPITEMRCIYLHRTELNCRERLGVEPDAFLSKEHRPARVEPNEHGNQ